MTQDLSQTPEAPQPKAKRGPKAKSISTATPEPAPETPTPDFIKIKEPESKFEGLRAKAIQKIMENRNRVEPEITQSPPTQRMLEQTRLEMEAGRKRIEASKKRDQINPPPKPKSDGTTTAVFRPQDYVPNMKQGYVNAKTVAGG